MKFLCYLIFFILYLSSYYAVAQYSDASSALRLYNIDTLIIESSVGEGSEQNEADFISCFMQNGSSNAEKNSVWLRFHIESGTKLTFTLYPDNQEDDLNFVAFKVPNDGDLRMKKMIRCMSASLDCGETTGLSESAHDISEDTMCDRESDDGFLAPLKVQKGDMYLLLISNFAENPNKYRIWFGGDCHFE